MNELRVIALDPGITTGYAEGLITDGKLGVISGQLKLNEVEMHRELKERNPDIIIYERFEYRSKKAYNVDNAELFPRNLIGVINFYCQERELDGRPLMQVHTQMPATVLGKRCYWTNEKLKAAGVYKVANPHANDAMRHLLYWYKFGPGYKFNTDGFEALA